MAKLLPDLARSAPPSAASGTKTPGKKLDAAAREVNLVWNHCNGAQRHALKHNQRLQKEAPSTPRKRLDGEDVTG
jgi:hypothetical protein